MPTTYAHYRFGEDVFRMLPANIQEEIRPYRRLFDIGLHGPDILFYDNPAHMNPTNYLGRTIHREPGRVYFNEAKELYKLSHCKKRLQAYLYGFVCHFTLDYMCHPYIEKMIRTSGIRHNTIETEFDCYLMRKDGLDPVVTLPTRHLKASKSQCHVIAESYASMTSHGIEKTLLWMRVVLRLIHAPVGLKRAIILGALKVSKMYEKFGGLITNPTADPDCQYFCHLLDGLYEKAIPECVNNIIAYRETLHTDRTLPKSFDKTFGAGKKWKKLSLDVK